MDADIVICDPAKEFTITNEKMHSDCDHTIHPPAVREKPGRMIRFTRVSQANMNRK